MPRGDSGVGAETQREAVPPPGCEGDFDEIRSLAHHSAAHPRERAFKTILISAVLHGASLIHWDWRVRGIVMDEARVVRPNRSQLSWDLVDLEASLPGDHRARIVWAFVEGLDLRPL
jgi:hypothetical protein